MHAPRKNHLGKQWYLKYQTWFLNSGWRLAQLTRGLVILLSCRPGMWPILKLQMLWLKSSPNKLNVYDQPFVLVFLLYPLQLWTAMTVYFLNRDWFACRRGEIQWSEVPFWNTFNFTNEAWKLLYELPGCWMFSIWIFGGILVSLNETLVRLGTWRSFVKLLWKKRVT